MTITREFQTGFELNSVTAETSATLLQYSGAVVVANTQVKTGSYALKVGNPGTYGADPAAAVFNTSASRQKRCGWQMRLQANKNDTMDRYWRVFDIRDVSGNKLVTLRYNGGIQTLYLDVGGSNKASYTTYNNDVWKHFSVDVKIDSSAGWVKVYMNGSLIMSWSGNTGNANITDILLGNFPGLGDYYCQVNYIYFDDLYIDDTAGESEPTSAPPIRYFQVVAPNADGNYSQWVGSDGNSTNNYALVDEIPPSTADYIICSGVDVLDSYNMDTTTIPANHEIVALIPTVYAKKTGLTDVQVALGTRLSSTDLVGSDQTLTGTDALYFERQLTKPGGGNWTQTDLDAVETVVKSRGSY